MQKKTKPSLIRNLPVLHMLYFVSNYVSMRKPSLSHLSLKLVNYSILYSGVDFFYIYWSVVSRIRGYQAVQIGQMAKKNAIEPTDTKAKIHITQLSII